MDSARHPSQLLWAKRVADRSPPPFTADEYFHVTAGQNISIHVRRKRPECQSAGRTGHFVTDTASPLSFTYFFIPSAASAGVGQPKRITRPSSDDTRLPKRKLSVAKYSSSRCRRPLAAKSKSTDWPQCYWITRRLSIEGCHVYDEEPLRFLPFNKKTLYGQMIDKAYDDPLRATHPRSSGSNFLSVPLPGNRLYLETVSETTQLRQHPTRDN